MADPKADPDKPVVAWEDFERATDLVVADHRPPEDQPQEAINS